MKRTHRILSVLAATLVTLLATAAPALAQYDSTGDDAIGFGILCCYGIGGLIALAMLIIWIWMLIDLIQRQEHEFPNSTGSSKTIWLIVMLVSWLVGFSGIAALVYYFMVYKKAKRGTMPPPGGGFAPPTGGAGAPPAGGGAPPPPAGGAGTPPPPPPGGGTPPPPPAQ